MSSTSTNGVVHKPSDWDWTKIIRSNILQLTPYVCARDIYDSGILLDANENSIGNALVQDADILEMQLNRYPSPTQIEIKDRLAKMRGFNAGASGVFLGVGSDEIIDLLIRITSTPQKDPILICPPTYGMYSVCAAINDVPVLKVPLDLNSFQPNIDQLLKTLSTHKPSPKLLFLTSPGNPTSRLVKLASVRQILDHPTWRGIVVMDEAYIDFADAAGSGITLLNEGYKNLIVIQTLSKGFGLAGIRLGFSFADPQLAQFMANTKAPYNISTPTATLALRALNNESIQVAKQNVLQLIENRKILEAALMSTELQSRGIGRIIGGRDGNFLLVQVLSKTSRVADNERAHSIYTSLAERKGVVVRFRGNEAGCEGCLRISVGTRAECDQVIERIRQLLDEM